MTDPFAPSIHPLERLVDELEAATDEYTEAIDNEATARAAYKRAWSLAFLKADSAATTRHKFAEAEAVQEDIDLIFAEAAQKRCRAKVESLKDQMSALQSLLRFQSGQS